MGSNSGTVRTTRRRLRVAEPPPSSSEKLTRLAAVLDDAAEQAGWGRPPSLIRITRWPAADGDDFDLGIRPLDDDTGGVVEALLCFDAPPDWQVLGVVTEGNARHLDAGRGTAPRRVRCVHLVDRSGASGSVIHLQGHDAVVLPPEHEPEGRVHDVCLRALGLPTAAPTTTTAAYWALTWLCAIAERQTLEGVPLDDWVDVATLHPAAAVLVSDDDRWARDAADNLMRLGRQMAKVHDWSVLRRECAAGNVVIDDMAPEVAAWLDDGAFSRWVLGGFPPLDAMADAVADSLPPSLARRVRAALRGWGLGPRAA